jgi:hypothetical protein
MTADSDQVKAAVQMYLYGYPCLYGLDEIAKFPHGDATVLPGKHAFNQFGHARELLGPDVAFVSPNNDTLYSVGPFDLSGGSLVLEVPDTADRYYGLQFIDAWSNNFAYVGRRATGTEAATFLLVPPGWVGDAPAGTKAVIEAPTYVGLVLGRIEVNGHADLPAVHALQDQFDLTPFGEPGPLQDIPEPDPGVSAELRWWEQFRVALAAFPPAEGDAPFLETAASLGLTDVESPYVRPAPDLAAALAEGQNQGEAMIEQLSKTSLRIERGWSSARHAFDYNLDHLGLGTIDAPEWKIADRTTAYVTRAVAARLGLWGNHGYEADYEILWQDGDGEFLDGSHRYEVTFDPPPPVDAFWSMTMYDVPNYYLVDNPIDRYSIGDRTPGLVMGDDGSLTLYLQHDPPDPGKKANWLPSPSGKFRPVLRCYQPGSSILDGTYELPELTRVD